MTATYFGFNPPFVGGPQGVMSRQEDERLIKNDILQLLLTIPGERVHMPDYGVNLRNFVFENLTEADISVLESEITSKINKYEQRVTIDDINLTPDYDRYGLQIKITVTLNNTIRSQFSVEQFIAGAQKT